MLGAIFGDVCGSVYEFNNCKDIDKIELFKNGCFPTDDSIMTIAVARALMDSKGLPDNQVKEAVINSMHYYGNLFPDAGYGQTFNRWLKGYYRNAYNSFGNGSAMRVSSVGWLFDSLLRVLHYARLTAEVTHSHPEGIKGAEAIASCIFLARTGSSKKDIKEYIEESYYDLDFTLDEIRSEYEFDVSCQGSCPQTIEAFLEGESFEDTILKAISIGGDSDTIACMAGAIAEAFYGIPADLKEKAKKVLFTKTLEIGGNNRNDALVSVITVFNDY